MTRPQLSIPLVLQVPSQVADGAGGYTSDWADLGTLWADIAPKGGGLRKGEGGPVSRARLRILVRAAPPGDPARPVPGQRLVGEGMHYDIEAVEPYDRAGLYLACLVQTEVMA